MLTDFIFYKFSKMINWAWSLDKMNYEQLSQLSGDSFLIKMIDFPVNFVILFNTQEILIQKVVQNLNPTVTIEGSIYSFIRLVSYRDRERVNEVVTQGLQIKGDMEKLLLFRNIISEFNIDWEEQLSNVFGDIVAHQLIVSYKKGCQYISEQKHSTQLNITEYLQAEALLLPTRLELEEFYTDVDHIKMDVDRLATRLFKLNRSCF